jgi:hypothetical protein
MLFADKSLQKILEFDVIALENIQLNAFYLIHVNCILPYKRMLGYNYTKKFSMTM